MASKSFIDLAGLQHYDEKLRKSLENPKHSYTTAANAAKNWFRIANAESSPLDESTPLHCQFRIRAYNSKAGVGYWQTWFVDAEVSGKNAGLHIFGESAMPFSQARILYENTDADVTSDVRPAIDIYLNYVLESATTVEVEEIANSGFVFAVDGALSVSSVPSGYESRAAAPYAAGISAAESASKLATARNINGTSFNGTSAITTATWGTARNISISDADGTNTGDAVSVNGSEAVTLKLPSTIKANFVGSFSGASTSCTGNAATATKLQTARTINVSDADGTNTGTGASFDGSDSATIKLPSTIKANITGNISGSSGSCTGNAATATKFASAQSVALTGAVTGTVSSQAGWTVPTIWRSCMVGQSGSTTTNPWYKVATFAVTAANDDIIATFLVEDTYSSHKQGILKVHVRTDGSKVITAASSDLIWLAHTGFDAGDFVLVCPDGVSGTAEIWTKIATSYMYRRFTVLSEGSRSSTAVRWTLLDASSAGQEASISTEGTQIQSVMSGQAGTAESAAKLSTARSINGTSFDGTAAITTAKWGTARNVSISDADGTNTGDAVSVNGSEAVTLKLPSTIKANITGSVSGSSGSCTGNAATATVLKTARTINVSDADGTNTGTAASFNGSENVVVKLPATIKASLSGNAESASKLATARNINGTSFNGTSAITTATWGTARDVSISDADGTNVGEAVSVNGSKAVILTLPSTIKASITGNASSADSVPWTGVEDKPSTFTPSSHNQASSTINAMTGYSKPSSTSAIGTSDTLNAAIGKLEKALDDKAASSHNQASSTINAMTGYSKPSSTSAIGTSDTLNAAIGKLEKALDDKAASSHSHASSEVTAMTSYAKPSSTSAIAATDTLNAAIGKLEKALDGKAASSHGTHVTYSTSSPLAAGTASAGSANNVSRGDHVHPLQTEISGNAGTATIAKGIIFAVPDQTSSTANLTASASEVSEYFPGLAIALRMPFSSVSNQKLNINDLGAKPIYYQSNTTTAGLFPSGSVVLLVYETASVSTGCFKAVYSYNSADTHYTTKLYASNSASGTSNSSQTTGNDSTYLVVCDNSTSRGGVQIIGDGGTTVTAASGILQIHSDEVPSFSYAGNGDIDELFETSEPPLVDKEMTIPSTNGYLKFMLLKPTGGSGGVNGGPDPVAWTVVEGPATIRSNTDYVYEISDYGCQMMQSITGIVMALRMTDQQGTAHFYSCAGSSIPNCEDSEYATWDAAISAASYYDMSIDEYMYWNAVQFNSEDVLYENDSVAYYLNYEGSPTSNSTGSLRGGDPYVLVDDTTNEFFRFTLENTGNGKYEMTFRWVVRVAPH